MGRALEQGDRRIASDAGRRRALLLLPAGAVLALFFAVPFAANLLFSARDTTPGAAAALTLKHYARLLGDPYYLTVVAQTFVLGVAVTAATLVLGYPLALALARAHGPAKGFGLLMVIAPLLVSIIVRSYGWLVVLGRNGLVNRTLMGLGLLEEPLDLVHNWTGVVIGLTHVLLPFMVLPIASVLEGLDPAIEEAARVHGATPWRTFRRVVFPLSLEGVATGCVLTFMLTIGSFVTVLLLGGKGTMVLPLLIYQEVTVTSDLGFASAIATVLLVIALALLYVQVRSLQVRGRLEA